MLDIACISVPDGIDKVYHFIGFSLFSASAIRTFISFFGRDKINSFIISLLIFGGLFAGLMEVLQNYTPSRNCDVYDWAANILGIAFVCVLYFLINCKQKRVMKTRQNIFCFNDANIQL